MSSLHVCPLSRLEATLRESGAQSLVTLMTSRITPPPAIAVDHHLWLDLSDIAEPLEGHMLPGAHHVEALLRFVTQWDRATPLLIHCYAGVSRSTAAAYAALCALRPDAEEAAIATELRVASPTATPNVRIVALADQVLGRHGRMVAAIQDIGRGVDCFEGIPFALRVAR